jgi:hypothetical protein
VSARAAPLGSPAGDDACPLRVLHCPTDIAGQASLSVVGLRARGHAADCFAPPHAFAYGARPDFWVEGRTRAGRTARRALWAARAAGRYDVFHFHSGQSFLPGALGNSDARLLRALGRVVAVEFWGSDARLPSVEQARNPFYVNAYDERDSSRRLLDRWAGITGGHAIVSDHSLHAGLEAHFPHLHVVRQRVDVTAYTAAPPSPDAHVPVVVHAPSKRAAKGTRHVRDAVEALRGAGLRFEYEEVHGLTQREALEAYRRADLIVDQLCYGSHGVFAVEAMALAKPVICYILPELESTYPEGFPVINANPDTLSGVLEAWLRDGEARHGRGLESRAYAERVHDCGVVADRLVRAYSAMR